MTGAAADTGTGVRRWHAELAWLGARAAGPPRTGLPQSGLPQGEPAQGRLAQGTLAQTVLARNVLIEASGERFTSVIPGVTDVPPDARRLPGLTLPGLANAHSHAFHRALRGAGSGGTFWAWRERMYEVAARLTPDMYYALARAVYAEMALAGVTCVGEFNYIHHTPGGQPYSDPNEMGRLLMSAAAAAGIRITLLDTCYLADGFAPGGSPLPLSGPRLRFGDGSADAWASRMADFGCDSLGMAGPHARLGAAIHSVRAVPPTAMGEVMAWSHAHGAPVHVHLSEQPEENSQCLAAFGGTPAQTLDGAGVLGPRTTVVHATHVSPPDVALIGGSRTAVCACPLTEADLADGVGPFPDLAAAGCAIALGSDGHSAVDMLAEARWLELGQRLVSGRRGHFGVPALAGALTASGHACLGWPDAGEIVPGAHADLVTVSADSPRLAGSGPSGLLERLLAAGTAADVRDVVVSGTDVVSGGRHLLVGDVPGALASSISAVLGSTAFKSPVGG